MLFQPVVIVGNQLFHHRVQRANILRSGMDIGVYQVDEHFNAVNGLGDRTRVIGIDPVNLVEHCFDFLVGHLGNVTDNDTLLFQLFPNFHEVFRVGIVGHDHSDPLHDLVNGTLKDTAAYSAFNDVLQPFRNFKCIVTGDRTYQSFDCVCKSLIVTTEIFVDDLIKNFLITGLKFRRGRFLCNNSFGSRRLVVSKCDQRDADGRERYTAGKQHRQKLL